MHSKTHFNAAQSFVNNDITCLSLQPGDFVDKFKTISRGIKRFKPSSEPVTNLTETDEARKPRPILKGRQGRLTEAVNEVKSSMSVEEKKQTFGKAFVNLVKKEYYQENMDKIKPGPLTNDVLSNCNHTRTISTSQDFRRSRTGRGGGLGKVDLVKIREFGKIGFE